MENPALSANRLPEQIAGEMIMLSRAGIEFTALIRSFVSAPRYLPICGTLK